MILENMKQINNKVIYLFIFKNKKYIRYNYFGKFVVYGHNKQIYKKRRI